MLLNNGDCIEVMQRLIDDGVQVDSVVTDPPYHLTSIVERFGKEGSAPVKVNEFFNKENGGICTDAHDIEPMHEWVRYGDALSKSYTKCDYIITNPPWNRKILHPMIEHFVSQKPTWLLFDSDWMHTKQSIPYLKYLSKIVSIGRVKWIEGSSSVGKDNCCWYFFESDIGKKNTIEFFGRTS